LRPLKIILIEKTRDSLPSGSLYDNFHKKSMLLTRTIQQFLKDKGNDLSIAMGLKEVTDETYSHTDCVLIHPSYEDIPRLRDLHNRYPNVGIIISPGDLSWDSSNKPYVKLEKDCDGINILYKGYGSRELLDAIKQVVKTRSVNGR